MTKWPGFSLKKLVKLLLLFKEFDINMNGLLDFTEFLVAIHCLATSRAAEQLQFVLRLVDRDRSGTIQVHKLVELFGTLYLFEGP